MSRTSPPRQKVPRPQPPRVRRTTTYWGYTMYMPNGGVWKYGITRVGVSRPMAQQKDCQKDLGTTRKCTYKIQVVGTNYFQARVWEYVRIKSYLRQHGHCPWGQYMSCK